MTSTSSTPATVSSSGFLADEFIGLQTLVRFMLRRDKVRLPAWVGGTGLFVVYLCTAIPTAYPSEEDLANALELFGGPMGRMLIGPGYGFDAPTHERFIANGYGLYLFILAALMSILLVVRHTRAEEQSGREELVRANVVGRRASLTAALIIALIANLGAGLAIVFVMVAVGGFGFAGSLLLAASTTATGLAFAGVTAITVQLTEYSRSAASLAGMVLGAAFVLRAGGDMVRTGGSALSWLSPLAWGQQTAPFVLDRWWPLLFPMALACVTAAVGYALSTRRDLGAGLMAVRPGAASAHPWLGTTWGLALRLQQNSILGWTIALAISGLVFGAFADSMLDAGTEMPEVFAEVFAADDLLDGYIAYMATFMAYLISVFSVLAVQDLRSDEISGRSEPLLAMPVSRTAWLATYTTVAAAAVILMAAASGIASGIGTAIVTGQSNYIGEVTLAHLNQVPAILVVLGVATLCFGLLPRAIAVTWVIVGYGLIAGTFGQILDLPRIALDLSPFAHPTRLPIESFRSAPLVALTVLAVAIWTIGLAAFRRRDFDAV